MLAGHVAAKTDDVFGHLKGGIAFAVVTTAALSTGCAAGAPLERVHEATHALHVDAAPVAALAPLRALERAPGERSRAHHARPIVVLASEVHIISNELDTSTAVAAWRSPAGDAENQILSSTTRCPVEMALVDDRVCVDRWEASLIERQPNGEELPWSPYLSIEGHEGSVRAVSRPGVVPQGYISGEQAMRACMASGKRLCAADEWERACRGQSGARFPYGDHRHRHTCNDDIRAVHPVAEVGALLGIPENRLWYEGMNQPLINQLPNGLLQTGARAECTNEYGVFDMVGNLHEWIDDRDGTFRGGYYMDTTLNGEGCSYATTAHDFRYHDYSTGFRCCMDPDRVE
jgi:formylglycine-generating enzyme